MSKFSDFDKVSKVIESCETIDQLIVANRMISMFRKNYQTENRGLTLDLQRMKYSKMVTIRSANIKKYEKSEGDSYEEHF